MIKVHVGTDGTKSYQVYGRSRVRDKSVRVYVGSFPSKRDAEHADQQHRVTQRGIREGDLPPAVDHTRTLGDALDSWLRAFKDQRSRDEYSDRMRLYVRPVFDSTPVVKITKSKLLELRSDLRDWRQLLLRTTKVIVADHAASARCRSPRRPPTACSRRSPRRSATSSSKAIRMQVSTLDDEPRWPHLICADSELLPFLGPGTRYRAFIISSRRALTCARSGPTASRRQRGAGSKDSSGSISHNIPSFGAPCISSRRTRCSNQARSFACVRRARRKRTTPYSNWQWATVCVSESMVALRRGSSARSSSSGTYPSFTRRTIAPRPRTGSEPCSLKKLIDRVD